MKLFKKCLSGILVVIMLATMIPLGATSVYADEADVAAEAESQTVAPATDVPVTVSTPASGKRSTSSNSFEYDITDEGIVITHAFSDETTLKIPSQIDGLPVVAVVSLGWCYDVWNLIIPDSVKRIGDSLLEELPYLESVSFGAGVSNLTADMFLSSYDLNSITVSKKNPNYCVIDKGLHDKKATTLIAYPVNNKDRTYKIPDTVSDISVLNNEFYRDIKVVYSATSKHFVTEDGVIYNKAKTEIVACDPSKKGTYKMPSTVKTIAPNAFKNSKLTKVVVSSKVTDIAYAAFADCSKLEQVTLPSGLVSIGESAFAGTTKLTSIKLPSKVKEIGVSAFSDSGIKSVTFPDSVTTIKANAFAYTSITSVTIPDSVTTMGDSAFYYCKALTSLTLGKGLRYIPECCFYGTGIKKVTLPSKIKEVRDGAFMSSALESVTFKNAAVQVHDYAFAYCNLKSLKLGDKMTSIEERAFAGNNFEKVTIPKSVTEIVYEAFLGCEKLAEIDIPTTAISIDGHTFDNTAWYNKAKDGVTYIGDHVLYNFKGHMKSNTKVTVKKGVTVIANYAFENRYHLTSIKLPDSLLAIGNYAFFACASLSSIHIPANVQSIGWNTFRGCASLKKITVDPANKYFYVSKDGALCTKAGEIIFDPKNNSKCTSKGIESWPDKYTYYLDEPLDTTGLILYKSYSGICSYIEDDITCKGFSSSKAGTKTVKVYYKDTKFGEFTVEVLNKRTSDNLKLSLSTTSYTYNGTVRKPTVTVKDSKGKKISSSNYTVTYPEGRKNVGTYKVKVTFKGDYVGTEYLSFTINPIKSSKLKLSLSTTSYTYNGKAKKPTVTVKNSRGNKLIEGTDYTVTYPSGRKNVGTYKVKVTFKGKYSGTEYLTFKVNPAKTSVKSLTAGSKSLKVTIGKKTTQVTGYQIEYSTSKIFSSKYTKSKTISSNKTTSVTLKSLKANKTYYVRVRTYKVVDGKKYYSAWSTVKTKTTK